MLSMRIVEKYALRGLHDNISFSLHELQEGEQWSGVGRGLLASSVGTAT